MDQNQLIGQSNPWVKFTNILRAAFTLADPESAKKLLDLNVYLALLVSARVKVARRMLMKLTPGGYDGLAEAVRVVRLSETVPHAYVERTTTLSEYFFKLNFLFLIFVVVVVVVVVFEATNGMKEVLLPHHLPLVRTFLLGTEILLV